jgi:hypothetical protein
MKRIGRYQLQVRTLLLLPALVAPSWWIADLMIASRNRSEDYQHLAALHGSEELDCLKIAGTPLPVGYGTGVYDTGRDYGMCPILEERTRPLSEVEKNKERSVRQQAGRRAAYHRALKRKYLLLARFPWLPTWGDPAPAG